MSTPRLDLYDLTRAQLTEQVTAWGIKPIHVARLWKYLYIDLVDSLDSMPGLLPRLAERVAAETTLGVLPTAVESASNDGFTRKYLLSLSDDARIETVLMRYTGRVTACVSSQVGCAMGCVFCATGQMGYTRHLTPGEIVAQVVHVARVLRRDAPVRPPSNRLAPAMPVSDYAERPLGTRLRNVVLMGMGEPMHNYEAVMHAIDILRDPHGPALAAERITLSTVGVVPGILRLAQEQRDVHLAVSLHAATQAERAALVPAARKWPLDELIAACRTYSEMTGRRIFYEWTLIEGKNDSVTHAHAVGALLRGLPAQVNLIPLNPTLGYHGVPTHTEAARRFQQVLANAYAIPSTVRQRRGIDIAAGCGQLAVGTQDERTTRVASATTA